MRDKICVRGRDIQKQNKKLDVFRHLLYLKKMLNFSDTFLLISVHFNNNKVDLYTTLPIIKD